MTPLRRRMLEDMQIRNLSAGTQAIYLAQVSQFARYFGKPPDVLGEQEIRAYQLHLTQEKKLAPSTITVAVSALRFLYQVTRRRRWNFEDIIPCPQDARQTAGHSQSRGSIGVPGLCVCGQTPDPAHHLLGCRPAPLRSHSPHHLRHR